MSNEICTSFGINTSIPSGDRVHTRHFLVCGPPVTLKMFSRSPKSIQYLPHIQRCISADLIKMHISLQEIERTQEATPMATPMDSVWVGGGSGETI